MMENKPIGMRLVYFLLAVILVIYGLVMAKEFLYPLAFGILLAYMLYPVVNFLEKKGMPRIFSILVPILIGLTFVVFLALFVLKRINLFVDELPYFRAKTIENIESIQYYIEGEFGIPAERFKNFLLTKIDEIGNESGKVFTTTTGTLFVILMQPVYIFLFLYYRTKLAYFFLKIAGRQNRLITLKVLREIATVVTRYMLGVTTVVIILCFFNSIGLLIIGIQYPLLLGVISAVFCFIPYFGNFIGGSIPFIFALLTEDSQVYALRIAIFVYVVHFFENNILSPNIVGNNIRINPFVVILGLIAGSMIWGLPGLLVAIPFLAMLNIVLKDIPGMQPYAFLLGQRGTKRHAMTFENMNRFFSTIKMKWNKKKGQP
jgi:predicted PurR-regulated permease PerM